MEKLYTEKSKPMLSIYFFTGFAER